MAFATVTALAHGIAGSPTFLGVIRLKNGKIVLWDATRIWIMASSASSAVLFYTSVAANFGVGAAGLAVIDGFERVIVTSLANTFQFIEFDGAGVAARSQRTFLTASTPAKAICFGNDRFWILMNTASNASQHAIHVLPNALTVAPTITEWTEATDAFAVAGDMPGHPVPFNVWPYASSIPEYDFTSLAYFEQITHYMDETLRISSLTYPYIVTCGARVGSHIIIGCTNTNDDSLKLKTDLSADTDGVISSLATGSRVIAVHWDAVSSKYLAAVNVSGGSTNIYQSAGGLTFGLSGNHPTTCDRAQFFSVDTRVFLSASNSGSPQLWRSNDGSTWTNIRSASSKVFGAYSNSHTVAGTIVELDSFDGTFRYSTDRGTTWSSPTAALIDAVAAIEIEYIQETSTGLIAWGSTGRAYTQVAADIVTVAWTDISVPTPAAVGTWGGFKVWDDGTTVIAHKKLLDGSGHHQTWIYTGTWSDNSACEYATSYWGFRDVSISSEGVPTTGLVAASYGATNNLTVGLDYDTIFVATVADPQPGVNAPRPVLGINPSAIICTDGQRRVVAAGQYEKFVYFNGRTFDGNTWTPATDTFVDHNNDPHNIAHLRAQGDTIIAISTDGYVAVSGDGNFWTTVIEANTDIVDASANLV